jgi:hypothetical protein
MGCTPKSRRTCCGPGLRLRQSHTYAARGHLQAAREHDTEHIRRLCSQPHADAELVGALRDGERHDSEDANNDRSGLLVAQGD